MSDAFTSSYISAGISKKIRGILIFKYFNFWVIVRLHTVFGFDPTKEHNWVAIDAGKTCTCSSLKLLILQNQDRACYMVCRKVFFKIAGQKIVYRDLNCRCIDFRGQLTNKNYCAMSSPGVTFLVTISFPQSPLISMTNICDKLE